MTMLLPRVDRRKETRTLFEVLEQEARVLVFQIREGDAQRVRGCGPELAGAKLRR